MTPEWIAFLKWFAIPLIMGWCVFQIWIVFQIGKEERRCHDECLKAVRELEGVE